MRKTTSVLVLLTLCASCRYETYGFRTDVKNHTLRSGPTKISWIMIQDRTDQLDRWGWTIDSPSDSAANLCYINSSFRNSTLQSASTLTTDSKVNGSSHSAERKIDVDVYRSYTPLADTMLFYEYDPATHIASQHGIPSQVLFQPRHSYLIMMVDPHNQVRGLSFDCFITINERGHICEWIQRKIFSEPLPSCSGLNF